MSEDFSIRRAARQELAVTIGIAGTSGTGKTYSALRLGTGMVQVTGGRLALIDTEVDERGRGKSEHYAEWFDFDIVPFRPPYSPQRYVEALEYCQRSGACVVIVDSASDEHEGAGGIVEAKDARLNEMFEAACRRAERQNKEPPDLDEFERSHGQLAWVEPKTERKKMIAAIRRMGMHIIFCYRAKEKSAAFAKKPRPGTQAPKDNDGYAIITDPKWFFELTLRALLLPLANGVPTWNPVAMSEREFIRRPRQFDDLLKRFEGKPLCEEIGREIALWAKGGERTEPLPTKPQDQPKLNGDAGKPTDGDTTGGIADEIAAALRSATTLDEFESVKARLGKAIKRGHVNDADKARLFEIGSQRSKVLRGEAPEA